MLTLILYRTALPAVFTACWLYFFVGSAKNRLIDAKTLMAIPMGAVLSLFYLAFKAAPAIDSILSSYLLVFIFTTSLFSCAISDFVEMTVPRICSIWLVPFWLIFAKLNFLNIDFPSSLAGALLGFLIPWGAAKFFKLLTNKDGLGMGDVELLCMTGAFLGPSHLISTLNFASISCLTFALIRYLTSRSMTANSRLPFAPFISFGALMCLLTY